MFPSSSSLSPSAALVSGLFKTSKVHSDINIDWEQNKRKVLTGTLKHETKYNYNVGQPGVILAS